MSESNSSLFNISVERTRPGPQPEILNFAKDWSEKERLKEGLKKTIDSNNKGFQMLAKMGYKSGESLGKSNSGIVDPIPIVVKTNRKGLGKSKLETYLYFGIFFWTKEKDYIIFQ